MGLTKTQAILMLFIVAGQSCGIYLSLRQAGADGILFYLTGLCFLIGLYIVFRYWFMVYPPDKKELTSKQYILYALTSFALFVLGTFIGYQNQFENTSARTHGLAAIFIILFIPILWAQSMTVASLSIQKRDAWVSLALSPVCGFVLGVALKILLSF